MKRHPISDATHSVLPNAVVELSSFRGSGRHGFTHDIGASVTG